MGVVIATTLTDADGRYVLCGLDGDRESYLYATLARTCCSNRNVYLISTSSMASRLGPSTAARSKV
jgi:hypothetical protein